MALLPQLNEQRMPVAAIVVVVVVSILPFALTLAGIDLGSPIESAATAEAADSPEEAYRVLAGGFVHTILEWSAVGVALITVLLAFLHYHEKGEAATPIIGLAWFCAGLVDAIHTLGADRLFPVAATHEAFTDFTWLVSRTVNIVILIIGAALFVISGQAMSREKRKRGMGFVLSVTAFFALIAFAAVYVCAVEPALPRVIRPDGVLHRPLEMIPLAMYVLAALMIFPAFYKWHPSVFTHALLFSMVPHIAAQLHMGFGSSAAFDAHYHIAHFLKLIAYAVPLVGLMMDYRLTHAQEMLAQEERAGEFFVRQQAEEALAADRSILRIVLDNTSDLVSIKDASLRFTRVNKRQAEFLRLANPIDAVGKSEADFLDAAFAGASQKQDQEVLAGGRALTALEQRLTRDGQTQRLSTSKIPLKNAEGLSVGIVTIARL